MPAEPTTLSRSEGYFPTWLRSRGFIGPVVAIGVVQLVAAMDGPVVVFALPRIQSELGLSDAGRSWVVSAYLLTFGGLILLGGRLGDTFGRKRTFIAGVALFTVASALCSIAWTGGALVAARLLHGVAAAIVAPTCTALLATAFPKGPARNAATAVFGAMASIGAVLGLVLGGVLTEVSWRLVFVLNVPIGLLVIYLAYTMLQETQKERMRLDVAGAGLATLTFIAAVFGLSMGPEQGWLSALTIGSALVALVTFLAFIVVQRRAENPIVPFSLFVDRSRLATYMSMFLVSGLGFTLTVLIALYLQNVMGYSPLQAGLAFIPIAIAMAVGTVISSRLVARMSPRAIVITGAVLVLGGTLCGGLNLSRDIPYFPNLVLPIVVGAIGIGMITVPLGLSLVASVGPDRIGPASAILVMLQSLGGPLVLVVIQAVITLHIRSLGGAEESVRTMSALQLNALDLGYAYGVLWLAGVAVLLGAVALLIGYTSQDVAHGQKVQQATESGELGTGGP
ncbi:MAG: MFS transporter [Mycobacterium sp.]